jgi:hypothetical protein
MLGTVLIISVAETHNFYAAPAQSKHFDADPAPTAKPAETLQNSMTAFLKNEHKLTQRSYFKFFYD